MAEPLSDEDVAELISKVNAPKNTYIWTQGYMRRIIRTIDAQYGRIARLEQQFAEAQSGAAADRLEIIRLNNAVTTLKFWAHSRVEAREPMSREDELEIARLFRAADPLAGAREVGNG